MNIFNTIELYRKKKETDHGVEITDSEPHYSMIGVGCFGEPLRQHLQIFFRVRSPRMNLALLFAECGSTRLSREETDRVRGCVALHLQ